MRRAWDKPVTRACDANAEACCYGFAMGLGTSDRQKAANPLGSALDGDPRIAESLLEEARLFRANDRDASRGEEA